MTESLGHEATRPLRSTLRSNPVTRRPVTPPGATSSAQVSRPALKQRSPALDASLRPPSTKQRTNPAVMHRGSGFASSLSHPGKSRQAGRLPLARPSAAGSRAELP